MENKKVEELIKAQEIIEENGGLVQHSENVNEAIKERDFQIMKEVEEEEKRNASYFKPIPIDWILENLAEAMDSCVPACCSQGCSVEPDGYCSHGHPSVLLYHGMI